VTDPSIIPGPPPRSGKGPLERLSDKLAAFQDQLAPDEAALLAGMLSVAADAMGHSGDGPGRTQLVTVDPKAPSATMQLGDAAPALGPHLLHQFNAAFTADPTPADRTRPFIIPGTPPVAEPKFRIIP
jgi:hypothetical protein